MRYIGPKNKLARREGIDLSLKTQGSKSQSNLLRRLNIPPGQHGTTRFRKRTEYGKQLREKQKVKRTYGLTETQLKKYFELAQSELGNTAELLFAQLETRLDNIVYRLGLAPTRAAARQLVNHGHISVNDKKVTIPSYIVKIGDVVKFRKAKTEVIPYITSYMAQSEEMVPDWLSRKAAIGKITAKPTEVHVSADFNLQSVIEFYSR